MNPESRSNQYEIAGSRWRAPRNDKEELLPVVGQNLGAGPAEPGTVLLQAGQDDLVAVIDVSAAKTRDVARAGIMPLLRRSR
jgi:hypothetical protein